ncbi:MAG: cell wall anchor protein [Muribaculaceae bacterium]|nr:cell wall anchor protein [Muribaculaceae bacterium]
MSSLKYIFITILACLLSGVASASPVIKAKLDSATVVMGSITSLHLTVEQDPGVKGHFPLFKIAYEKGYAGLCGDSVELRAPMKIDTIKNNNSLTIKYDVPVQSFDSGFYKLPELEFVAGVDTFRSNNVALKVLPVANVTAETPIADYANVADPENPSIFDSLPDWLINYWWIFVIVIGIVIASIWLWKRYRDTGRILPKKPEPTPYEVAIAGLRGLKEKKLWENGMEKEYFTELTDILRIYLYRRFGINAMEMTSRQILAALSSNKETKDKKPMIRQILDMADFVKFAKVRPLPADNIKSLENAMTFVEQTKPLPPEEKNGEDDAKKGNGASDKDAESIQSAVKGNKAEKGGEK